MFHSKKRIDDFLHSGHLLIANSISDPECNAALATHGYPKDKLIAGNLLYEEALTLQLKQRSKSGEKVAATREFKTLWAEAEQMYMKALKIARVAFGDIAKAEKGVMLEGSRKQSFYGWLEQARTFYTNILNDSELSNLIAEYGYTREKLQGEIALLDGVEAQNLRQKKATGAIQDRDQKLNQLAAWVSALRAVAKVALADTPQSLEKLGIVTRRKR